MHHIAICENNPEDSALLQNILDDYELAMHSALNVRCFTDAESMLEYFSEHDYLPEVLLMDISLPGMSGLEAVKKLRRENFAGEVIFTTSSPEHALAAFEVNARQYFLKPVNQQRMFTALEGIMHPRRDYIFVKVGRSVRRIMCREIMYCETNGKYQIIHTPSEELRVRLSAKKMKILCTPHMQIFASLGTSILINLESVVSVINEKVIFADGEELRLSRRKVSALRKAIRNLHDP